MKQRIYAPALFALLAFAASPALAQSVSPVLLPNGCGTGNATNSLSYLTVDSTLKLCVNATVSASVSGFTSNGNFSTLTATASSSASTALPTGTVTRITNTSSTATVSCTESSGTATGVVSNI